MQRFQERIPDARYQAILAENRRLHQQNRKMETGAVQIIQDIIQHPLRQEIGQQRQGEKGVQGVGQERRQDDNAKNQGWFRKLLNKIRQTFSSLGQMFRNAWDKFVRFIDTIFTGATWIQIGRRILGGIIGFLIWVATFFTQAGRMAIDALVAGCQWIKQTVLYYGQKILSSFRSIWNTVRDYFTKR